MNVYDIEEALEEGVSMNDGDEHDIENEEAIRDDWLLLRWLSWQAVGSQCCGRRSGSKQYYSRVYYIYIFGGGRTS